MSNPDFRTFVDALIPVHRAWLSANPSASGNQFFDHYVGDASHQAGLLWQYEAWRAEHGYPRVRPWNGAEALGRTPLTGSEVPAIPFPGTVVPFVSIAGSAGPTIDARLASTVTTAALQASFGVGNVDALGAAIRDHWAVVQSFQTPYFATTDNEMRDSPTAPYSVRFWGFMKWADTMRSRLLGIPVFPIPIVTDADGVTLSELEFSELANRVHNVWHVLPACTAVTSQAAGNPFAPTQSPFGQLCGELSPRLPGEFFKFHRDVLHTYNNWRSRTGMPKVGRYRPDHLHFHAYDLADGGHLGEVQLDTDPGQEYTEIKDFVRHFNSLDELAEYANNNIHGDGHLDPTNPDIRNGYVNNYSPRFFGWHSWIDYLWNIRQARFNTLGPALSTGTSYSGILTYTHPQPNPDAIAPANALTALAGAGTGSLWLHYTVRPETYGRPIDLSITAQVFRHSGDMVPVAGLDATAINSSSVPQGADSGAVELHFSGTDSDGDGALAKVIRADGSVGFKNGRIQVTGRVVANGPIAGATHPHNRPDNDFDGQETFDFMLVQEAQAPTVSTLLNRSEFSNDEIVINAAGAGQSFFSDVFFVVAQDPPEPPLFSDFRSIFADPARTAVSGIFADPAFRPMIAIVDEMGNPVPWANAIFSDVFKEQPSLDDNVSQRVLFRYHLTFDVAFVTTTLIPNPGDTHEIRVRMGVRDRAGNAVAAVMSEPIRLFHKAHAYMIDVQGTNPSWLSVDTRVFSVTAADGRFGTTVAVAGGPNNYIRSIIPALNSGTLNFDALPADENQVPLELLPTVNGVAVYNFALAKVRMRTQSPIANVRAFFRLFTTANSDLSFTPVNYPTDAGAAIPLLGRTASREIVSIPFFAEERRETRDTAGGVSMTTQSDPTNVQTFEATLPGGETVHYFGAWLDINADSPRYPQAPAGDGPFPGADCVSIRNIIRGQHQCMAAEVYFEPDDPTRPNSTPATSDHLAQRNLLIIETDNPGGEATHTVQHSFDLVLPMRDQRFTGQAISRDMALVAHVPATVGAATMSIVASPALAVGAVAPSTSTNPTNEAVARWYTDELVVLWNNLPRDARVELYLPSVVVDFNLLLRRMRAAPETVHFLDNHTLQLDVEEVTYIPFLNLFGERVAGLITVTLPDGVRAGATYSLDVMQIRPQAGIVLGGFRLSIPVRKAAALYAREGRVLQVFEERLRLTPVTNRWHPILRRQVDYLRMRALGLAQEAADQCAGSTKEGQRIRIIVERIRVLDPYGPLVHGSQQVSFTAHVSSQNGGGAVTGLPASGTYTVGNDPLGSTITVNREVFRGMAGDDLQIEIMSAAEGSEPGICHYRRKFSGALSSWLGSYRPSDERPDPENVGDWQVWYRIEPV